MRYMASYDLMETFRNTNQWLGATALEFGSYPASGLVPNPFFKIMAAWGEVTERSFARMVTKPDWDIISVPNEDGRDHVVTVKKLVKKPFCDLLQFKVANRPEKSNRRGRVASITGQARSTLTRENGQPTDSNLAQPSSVILLRARTPICASVF